MFCCDHEEKQTRPQVYIKHRTCKVHYTAERALKSGLCMFPNITVVSTMFCTIHLHMLLVRSKVLVQVQLQFQTYLYLTIYKQTWRFWGDRGWRTLSQSISSLSQFLLWINTLTVKSTCQGTTEGVKKFLDCFFLLQYFLIFFSVYFFNRCDYSQPIILQTFQHEFMKRRAEEIFQVIQQKTKQYYFGGKLTVNSFLLNIF